MLCNVPARSRPVIQLLANTELPNGFELLSSVFRCGMEPALSRESRVALLAGGPFGLGWSERPEGVPAWNGLVDGVILVDLFIEDCELLNALRAGNRDGTVPALVRRGKELGVLSPDTWLASKSGKLSLPGDSGMVSRRGVE